MADVVACTYKPTTRCQNFQTVWVRIHRMGINRVAKRILTKISVAKMGGLNGRTVSHALFWKQVAVHITKDLVSQCIQTRRRERSPGNKVARTYYWLPQWAKTWADFWQLGIVKKNCTFFHVFTHSKPVQGKSNFWCASLTANYSCLVTLTMEWPNI